MDNDDSVELLQEKIKTDIIVFELDLAKKEKYNVRVFTDKLNNPLFCLIDLQKILILNGRDVSEIKRLHSQKVDERKYEVPISNEINKEKCVLIDELGVLKLIFSNTSRQAEQLQRQFLDKMHEIRNQIISIKEQITYEKEQQLMVEAKSYKELCKKQLEAAKQLIRDDKIVHKLENEKHNQYLILLRIVINDQISYQTLRCNKYNLDVKIAKQQKRIDTGQITSFTNIYQEKNGNPVQFWKLVWDICHKDFMLGEKNKKLFFQLKPEKTEQMLLEHITKIKTDNNNKIIQ